MGKRISMSRYEEATENSEGYCSACKKWTAECCEPDAREYECPRCKQPKVYGCEEAMMMGLVEVC